MKGAGHCLPCQVIAGTQHYSCQQKVWLWELHDEAGKNHMGGFGAVLGITKSSQTKVFCCALVLLFSLLSHILLCNFCSFYLSQQGGATGISFSHVSSYQTSEILMPPALTLWGSFEVTILWLLMEYCLSIAHTAGCSFRHTRNLEGLPLASLPKVWYSCLQEQLG